MNLGLKIKNGRKKMNLTQQELANRLHVTRQALSRWENNVSYPNLDMLVDISKSLNVSLNELLIEEQDGMVKRISDDVRDRKKYLKYLIMIGIFFLIIITWLCTLWYGRANQVSAIDQNNPFLKTEYGYALLPDKAPLKKQKVYITYNWDKKRKRKIHKQVTKMLKEPTSIDAFVVKDAFGNGEWMPFYTGRYDKNQHYAVVEHKGSYVSNARTINKNEIPQTIRDIIGNNYMKYQRTTPDEPGVVMDRRTSIVQND
ncbi:helix-turn-helix domain-containing protein [Apilactobacillus micheneri]|uniref:helix-turn-helix domain-containing protein n=1 Tax=Apilactobacillus micheneri TaxID=1899430 RepID=UPI000D0264D5|nr:helix-turn-helix domain-containing protein [Apilactobacillus micheneri]TPR37790.1 helix-turn-helix domain-containing protein [Apilactobacillus micheneri]